MNKYLGLILAFLLWFFGVISAPIAIIVSIIVFIFVKGKSTFLTGTIEMFDSAANSLMKAF